MPSKLTSSQKTPYALILSIEDFYLKYKQLKLLSKIANLIVECEELSDIKIVYGNIMRNRHMKPAFNLQHDVDSEYIIGAKTGSQTT